jgi:hypothetical protein
MNARYNRKIKAFIITFNKKTGAYAKNLYQKRLFLYKTGAGLKIYAEYKK